MPKVTLESRVSWGKDVLFRNLDGEAVLVSLASSTYFGLDPIGTRVWELIGQHALLADVLGRLIDEFDVERHRAEQDLLDLVDELMANGLVSFGDSESS